MTYGLDVSIKYVGLKWEEGCMRDDSIAQVNAATLSLNNLKGLVILAFFTLCEGGAGLPHNSPATDPGNCAQS